MSIQELYDEIDNQYNLYISEEGAGELPMTESHRLPLNSSPD